MDLASNGPAAQKAPAASSAAAPESRGLGNWLLPKLAASPLQEWYYRREAFVPVFMLHRLAQPECGIRGHDPDTVRQQLGWLRDHGWRFISAETLVETWRDGGQLPARSAVFTVDDGYHDQYRMAEIFDEFHCPATFFLITDFLDGKVWIWDAQLQYLFEQTRLEALDYRPYDDPQHPVQRHALGSLEERYRAHRTIRERLKALPNERVYAEVARLYRLADVEFPQAPPECHRPMSWDQARELVRRGHSIAPHTAPYRMLSRLPAPEAAAEIESSWHRLAKEGGEAPTVFAYPNGRAQDYDDEARQALARLNCRLAFSTEPGHARRTHLQNSPYDIPRFAMPDNLRDLSQYASWIEHAKDKLRNKK